MKKAISGVILTGLFLSSFSSPLVQASSLENVSFSKNEVHTLAIAKKQTSFYLDNYDVTSDLQPIEQKKGVYVNLLAVTDYMGAKTKVDLKKKIATIDNVTNKIVLIAGKDQIKINGKNKKVSVPAEVINGKLYVHTSFLNEGLGIKTKVNKKTGRIDLTIYEVVVNVMYYADKNGNLGNPITKKQLVDIGNNGIVPGREIVDVYGVGNVTNGLTEYIITRSIIVETDEGEVIITIAVDGKVDGKGKYLGKPTYNYGVISPGGNISEESGTLDGIKTYKQALKYSTYDFLEDYAYLD